MLKRNIVICAFWIGNCKPPISTFMEQLKKTFTDLGSSGFCVNTSEGTTTMYITPLYGVFDLVAKAPLMNMNQFNDVHLVFILVYGLVQVCICQDARNGTCPKNTKINKRCSEEG